MSGTAKTFWPRVHGLHSGCQRFPPFSSTWALHVASPGFLTAWYPQDLKTQCSPRNKPTCASALANSPLAKVSHRARPRGHGTDVDIGECDSLGTTNESIIIGYEHQQFYEILPRCLPKKEHQLLILVQSSAISVELFYIPTNT
jgi:hypothetical protein